jgi:hypothetical protein
MGAIAKAVRNVSSKLCRSYIGDNASAGPAYACAGGKLRMQIGLQDAVCHAMLMVCSRAYVPGLAKGYNTGLNRW